MYIVYLLTNRINDKKYVGVTNNYRKRMIQHKNSKSDYLISRAIQKYGWDNFIAEILIETESLDAYTLLESEYIQKYQSNNPETGYNMTAGGEGTIGYKHSDNTKEIFRALKLGKKLSPDHIKNISESNKGRICSVDTRKKISNANKGKQMWLGKTLSDEHKSKLSEKKSKNWKLISPTGETILIHNMRKFCLSNNLHPSAICRVIQGKQTHHKHWTV